MGNIYYTAYYYTVHIKKVLYIVLYSIVNVRTEILFLDAIAIKIHS